MVIKWNDFIAQRDIVLDILFVSVQEGRLHQEELVEVAKRLYSLTNKVVGEVEIFKEVRDKIEEGRREI